MGFGFGFGAFGAIFTVMFVLVIGMFVVTFVKGIGEWNKNNNSPRLIVPAVIVAKRTNVHRHHHNNHPHTTTTYYVTFEVESGDRMELRMDGDEYGLLVEGNTGLLTFQGTRYLGFERR